MSTVQLFEPGSDEYAAATKPDNSSGDEHPAFVAKPGSADDVAALVGEAASRGLRLVPQATGHGAGGTLGSDVILVDTSGLDDLTIDPDARTAAAGAGLQWGAIQPAAQQHGLLGLAGSSPTVAICGYTFGGGVGWLTRPHGMASSALRAVQYVDGAGRVRLATEDADEQLDRDALYAFRGGGGVGIATRLEFDLVPVPDLHAGYLLWPIEHLDDLVAAWVAGVSEVADDVATSIAVLHLPPAPPFPEALRGTAVVHLAVAASAGEAGALPLLRRVRATATPAVDTWGAADVAALSGIHLDPPGAVPAIGAGRWLGAGAPEIAAATLAVAAPADSPLALIEIRSVGNAATGRDGALTSVPGPFVLHAVGALVRPEARSPVESAIAQMRAASAPADIGLSLGSWMEGATSVPDALPTDVRSRVAAIADAVDPDRRIARSRFLA